MLSLKQPYYKEALKVKRNYNKVLRPDKIHMIADTFNNGKFAGGGRRGLRGASTRMEYRALQRLKVKRQSRRNPSQSTEE
jgi:hypothetical protein